MSIEVRYKLWPGGIAPMKLTSRSACFDLALPDDIVIPPHSTVTVDLKIGFEPKDGRHYMMMYPRSSLLHKYNLIMPTSVIDNDYRGPVHAIMCNITDWEVKLSAGTRIAQVNMFQEVETRFEQVDNLSTTVRGIGGLGSTGV
jgi:deoxyuridine 5'-triphosphate nucleotidohydrolase